MESLDIKMLAEVIGGAGRTPTTQSAVETESMMQNCVTLERTEEAARPHAPALADRYGAEARRCWDDLGPELPQPC